MRIGILTLPLHTNYGGILQAYALQTVLERMGHEVVIFDCPLRKLNCQFGRSHCATTAGSQIYKLIVTPEVNLDYLKKVLKSISNNNVRFHVYKITKWNSENDFDIDEKDVLDMS